MDAMKREKTELDRMLDLIFQIWLAVGALLIVFIVGGYLVGGVPLLARSLHQGPLSILPQTLFCTALVWGGVGVVAGLLRNPCFRVRHGMTLLLGFILMVLYANILRERVQYIDIDDYVKGAVALRDGLPFHARYIYLPFLATLCQPVLHFFGEQGVVATLWALNWFSLGFFFLFSVRLLQRYGIAVGMAHGLVFVFMLINVPLLRTLSYVQVNLHLLNLVMLSYLLYARSAFWSAALLAIAVHLKSSPIILALPFLFIRDFRWLGWFALWGIAGFLLTYLPYGWAPFASFLENARHIYAANGICLRDNSIDSLLRSTAICLKWPLQTVNHWVPVVKVVFALMLGYGVWRGVKDDAWSSASVKDSRERRVLDALPPLLMTMMLLSPLVWEHHFIFAMLPFLLLLRRIQHVRQVAFYLLSYLVVFWMPTFDFYPWSFSRWLGSIGVVILGVVAGSRVTMGFRDVENRVQRAWDALHSTRG